MSKISKPKIYPDTPEQRLSDFLFVYYPDDVARAMRKSPSLAFSNILEDIGYGISPLGRLSSYVRALHDAISLMGVTAQGKAHAMLSSYKPNLSGEVSDG